MGLQLCHRKVVSIRVREDDADVVFLDGGVFPSCCCPDVGDEPESGFVRVDGSPGDVEDSAPFVEDEDGVSHEGCFGVGSGGVGDDDLGVVYKGDCCEGSGCFGDWGDKMDATVVFAEDLEKYGTDADPEYRAKATSLCGALVWDGRGAETVCGT